MCTKISSIHTERFSRTSRYKISPPSGFVSRFSHLGCTITLKYVPVFLGIHFCFSKFFVSFIFNVDLYKKFTKNGCLLLRIYEISFSYPFCSNPFRSRYISKNVQILWIVHVKLSPVQIIRPERGMQMGGQLHVTLARLTVCS